MMNPVNTETLMLHSRGKGLIGSFCCWVRGGKVSRGGKSFGAGSQPRVLRECKCSDFPYYTKKDVDLQKLLQTQYRYIRIPLNTY